MPVHWISQYTHVKAIVQLKKTINLGEVPHHFNTVANKLQELEGTFTDGFANNITYLLDQQNWQMKNCQEGRPKVALIRHIDDYAFDLHCFPVIANAPQAVVKDFHPGSGFKQFNPAIAGPLIRIPQLRKLIDTYVKYADEADLELIKYAHILIEQLSEFYSKTLNVTQNSGKTIQQILTDAQDSQQAKH